MLGYIIKPEDMGDEAKEKMRAQAVEASLRRLEELTKALPKDCQSCEYHHCHYEVDGFQDCSCDLSVFATTCTHGRPLGCPLERKPVKEKDKIELKLDILEFAQEHNLAVHPDKDLDHFCEATVTFGHCICRNDELYCPCEQALPLCEKEGHCTCRLFITRESYKVELTKFRERWRKKHNENKGLRSNTLRAMPRGEKALRRRAFLNQRGGGGGGAD